jgi:hypothetical protein
MFRLLRRLLTNDNLSDGESLYLTPNYIRAGQSCGRFHFCLRLDFAVSWILFTSRTTNLILVSITYNIKFIY